MNATIDPHPPRRPTRGLHSRWLGAVAVAVAISLPAAADEAATPAATIADPWSRQPADGQDRSAVYGIVTNNGDETITAIAASTDIASTVELHETTMDDEGQMSMSEKEGGYEIAAGESLTFEPGGPHIMLFRIEVW